METMNILWRNMRWRFGNPISILLTLIQPLIWLFLYSTIAGQTMQDVSGGNYTAFILPGIMMLVTLACCSSGGYLNFIMKSQGSFYRILIAPVKRSAIVLGQMLETVILSFIEISILLLLSIFLSVRFSTGFVGLVLMLPLIFMSSFFMSGVSYIISLSLPNEAIYETVMNLIVLSLFFTSTALFPADNISGGFKIAMMLNPFTHIINGLRQFILETSIDWSYYFFVCGIFIGLCGVIFGLALWKLNKEYEHE